MTTEANLKHQQNLNSRRIGIVLLSKRLTELQNG